MALPAKIKLVEVGPRDGLQNEPQPISVGEKIRFIEDLARAGLPYIECGSFVSEKKVPQMSGTEAVFTGLEKRSGTIYAALVPNVKGLERAKACGVGEIAVIASASEQFSQANTSCSIGEGLERARAVCEQAVAYGLRVRGYVSCVLGCPYEGEVSLEMVRSVAASLQDMGCYEISLGDTIGIGTPLRAQKMLEAVLKAVAAQKIAVHFHDTWGQALANIFASIEMGVGVVDCSVAGLGGCPYAPGAAGNVATEDVVYMLDGMGIETGVVLEEVAFAGERLMNLLGRKSTSKASSAIASSLKSGKRVT